VGLELYEAEFTRLADEMRTHYMAHGPGHGIERVTRGYCVAIPKLPLGYVPVVPDDGRSYISTYQTGTAFALLRPIPRNLAHAARDHLATLSLQRG